MTESSEFTMTIKTVGEIDKNLLKSTDLAKKMIDEIAKEYKKDSKGLLVQGFEETEPLFNILEKAGMKAFKGMAAAASIAREAIVETCTMASQAGIGFESAFDGIKRNTNTTAQEYAQLKERILEMTREIPATGEEILAVTEAAGKLGIGKDNLLEFTRTMIDLGKTTDFSSYEAASALAEFANITNMNVDSYGRLGSTVAGLGNNFAITESDIVSMATRLASSGELAGYTEAQILAMATAISTVGIEAEEGGSSMNKMVTMVQEAVETGSKDLEEYAAVAGISIAEFRDAFEKDGLSAVAAFIGGLNDTERNGRSATAILDEMGLTEMNLSNTLLSLANADALMANAVGTANRAWEENVALTNEASMRYETTESKLTMLNSGFTEMGIAMYDQFNDPLREGIGIVTDLVHEVTDEIAGSNVIHDLAQDVMDGLPTAVRVIRETASAVADFADPFLAVGGWLAGNPGVIEGVAVGLGSALLTYKVAQGVMSLVTAFNALSTASLPILGLTGAIAVISGVTVAVKKSAEEAKSASLDEHFGKISLSMQEIEDVAAHILSTDSFGLLNESISELGKLDGINGRIEDAVSELNRMNWKVSVGMELEKEEQELYKQNIASYVADMQAYVEQEQYAINLSVGVLTGEDLENSNIVTQLNEFYSGKNAELVRLGAELNQVVTDAFNNNLFDIKAGEIADLQKQMADIKASLAEGSYEASLDLIGLKYAGGELDADTFQNLMSEISQQKEVAKKQYEEAYLAANQAQRAMLEAGPENGGITPEEYEANMEEIEAGYRQQVGTLDLKAADFVTGTIMQQYSDELGDRIGNADQILSDVLGRSLEDLEVNGIGVAAFDERWVAKNMGGRVKGADGRALAELWEIAGPMYDQLVANYQRNGGEIPEEMQDVIKRGAMLGVASGDYSNMYSALGLAAADNEEYRQMLEGFVDRGLYVPEQITEAILGNSDAVAAAVGELREDTERQVQDVMGEDIDVAAKINIRFETDYSSPTSRMGSRILKTGIDTISKAKDGGIFDRPHITWIAEAGPEAVIPLDGSRNARNLWKKTGEFLKMDEPSGRFGSFADNVESAMSLSGSGQSQFIYSPTLQIYGNSPDKKDIENVLETEQEKFTVMIERWMKDNSRISFS